MFSSVEYIRHICKQRKIAIRKLEKDCGFANGYLNPKQKTIPYERAVIIAEYLKISVDEIFGTSKEKNSPGKPEPTERELRILEALRSKTPDEQRALLTLLGISED